MSAETRRLAKQLNGLKPGPADPMLRRRAGTVTARSGASYTVTVGGVSVPGVRSLVPLAVGDVAELVFDGPLPLAVGHVDGGWVTPTLLNGWVNFDGAAGGWAVAGYRKIGGIVHVKGVVKDGATAGGTDIFVLAARHRPAESLVRSVPTNGVHTAIDILSDGTLQINVTTAANAAWLDLGCSFVAEQ